MASAMAIRAAGVSRPPLPPKQQQQFAQPSFEARPANNRRSPPLLSPANPASLSLLAVVAAPAATTGAAKAFALPKEDIVSSLTKVEDTIGQAVDVGSQVLNFTQNAIKSLTDVLKPGVDAALPVLQSAGEQALKVVGPMVTDASKQALQTAGVDPSPVISAAKTVADAAKQTTKIIDGAKPIASATVETITSSDPSLIVVSAGALFLGYLILPPIFSAISFSFRGYKGNLSPAQTLDLLSSQNYLLIDIRSEKDKNKAGVPRLPASAKNKLIALPLEELPSKIKGLVRNPKKVEAEIVALKISYLKKVNKGSKIVIMDSYSDTAKIVAKTLTSLGFENTWVMTDGFSGGRGWVQSRLGTDSYSASFAEIVSPSRVIPPAVAQFGTASSGRRLLPGSTDS